jgi:hypothetical protein
MGVQGVSIIFVVFIGRGYTDRIGTIGAARDSRYECFVDSFFRTSSPIDHKGHKSGRVAVGRRAMRTWY